MADETKQESTNTNGATETETSNASKTVNKLINRAQSMTKKNVTRFTSSQSGIALQKAKNFINLMNNSFAQSEKLYQNRLNANQRIQQLNTDYVVATQDVLNDKTLSFLVDHSKINVPTFTSIVAGFELARASRADKLQEMVKGEQDMIRENIKAEQDFVNQSTAYHDKLGQATNRYGDDLIRVGERGFQTTQDAVKMDVSQANTIENKATDQQYSLDKMAVQIDANTQARREGFKHDANMANLTTANKNTLANQKSTFPGDGGGRTGVERLADGTLVDSTTGEVIDENDISNITNGGTILDQLSSNIMGGATRSDGSFSPNDLMIDGSKVVDDSVRSTPESRREANFGSSSPSDIPNVDSSTPTYELNEAQTRAYENFQDFIAKGDDRRKSQTSFTISESGTPLVVMKGDDGRVLYNAWNKYNNKWGPAQNYIPESKRDPVLEKRGGYNPNINDAIINESDMVPVDYIPYQEPPKEPIRDTSPLPRNVSGSRAILVSEGNNIPSSDDEYQSNVVVQDAGYQQPNVIATNVPASQPSTEQSVPTKIVGGNIDNEQLARVISDPSYNASVDADGNLIIAQKPKEDDWKV